MRTLAVLLVFLVAGRVAPAWAAEGRPLVVTLDKAQVVRLIEPARRVIVGNPAIADVTLETPGMLYVFGKVPGETNLIVLGDHDREMVSRALVVTTNRQRAVSVHVPATNGPSSRNYSCLSDRCLPIASPSTEASGSGAGAASAAVPPPSAPLTPSGPSASAAPDIMQPAPVGTTPPFR
jgi:hypothetical protein